MPARGATCICTGIHLPGKTRDNIIIKRKALNGSRYSIDEDPTALNIKLVTIDQTTQSRAHTISSVVME